MEQYNVLYGGQIYCETVAMVDRVIDEKRITVNTNSSR